MTDSPVFQDMNETVPVGRYHSLAVDEKTLPPVLRIIARADDGEVMAVADEKKKVFGLQFHPESIMTPDGAKMLANFLNI